MDESSVSTKENETVPNRMIGDNGRDHLARRRDQLRTEVTLRTGTHHPTRRHLSRQFTVDELYWSQIRPFRRRLLQAERGKNPHRESAHRLISSPGFPTDFDAVGSHGIGESSEPVSNPTSGTWLPFRQRIL